MSDLAVMARTARDHKQTLIEGPHVSTSSTPRVGAHLTYSNIADIGKLFLSSGGSAVFHGDNVVSTRAGYRPSISPRGVLLDSGKWYYELSVITAGVFF